jgi:hypothetical protein
MKWMAVLKMPIAARARQMTHYQTEHPRITASTALCPSSHIATSVLKSTDLCRLSGCRPNRSDMIKLAQFRKMLFDDILVDQGQDLMPSSTQRGQLRFLLYVNRLHCVFEQMCLGITVRKAIRAIQVHCLANQSHVSFVCRSSSVARPLLSLNE